MKRTLSACCLGLACVFALNLPVAAAQPKTPVLTGESSTTVYAKPYRFDLPTGYHGTSSRDKIYLTAPERVYADNGKSYKVTDGSALEDSSNFRRKIQTTVNPHEVRSVELIKGSPKSGDNTCFLITLDNYYIYDDFKMSFEVTYTAVRDTALEVVPTDGVGNAKQLEVKKNAEIVLDYKVNITSDAFYVTDSESRRLSPKWYGDTLYLRDDSAPAGIDELVLSPVQDDELSSDWAWEDSEEIVVAELDLNSSSMLTIPKLSTRFADSGLAQKHNFGETYVRIFRNNPATDDGKEVTLTLTNPFQTLEGTETADHTKVRIYSLENGKLTEITDKFTYTTDSNDYGAFEIKTAELGSYVLSTVDLIK